MSPTPCPTPAARRTRRRPPLRAALVLLAALGGLQAHGLAAPAQDGKPVRLDQVAVRSRRGTNVTQVPGVVKQNTLADVVVLVAGKDEKYSSELVLRVTFGDVPTSYRDGTLFEERGDHASAAASFKLAAGDTEARDVVRASARLRAAQALLAWGATDPAHFAEAAEEARRFLSDHADNRETPQAQLVLARALWLAGKPAEAASAYREVHAKLAGDQAAEGYERADCFRAGLLAARALLEAGDTLGARELYSSLSGTLGPIVAGLEDSPEKRELQDVVDEAGLGEGFAELTAGNLSSALTFFEGKQRALTASSSDVMRSCVLLGLGESLLASGRAREAQLALAQVSALDHSDRDRVARALLRQAEAATKLGDPRERIKPLLTSVDRDFGDTPWAALARKLM